MTSSAVENPAFAGLRRGRESVAACAWESEIHRERLATWPEHYPWIETTGLQYFRNRVTQARRDVEQALQVTLGYFTTIEAQQRALDILQFKLDILWSMNDAMALAYGVGA